MKIKEASRLHTFLIEMIIVILFFSIAAGVTVRVFAKAHEIRQKANDLTMMTMTVQSIGEYAKHSNSLKAYKNKLEALGALEEDDNYLLYYNELGEKVLNTKEADYVVKIKASVEKKLEDKDLGEGGMLVTRIEAYRVNSKSKLNNEEIYTLEAKKYYPKVNG